MKSRVMILVFTGLSVIATLHAKTPPEYVRALPKESLNALEKDEVTKKFLATFTNYDIRVQESTNKLKAPDQGYFSGTMKTAVGPVEVGGLVNISSGVMQIQLPLEAVVPAIQHWQEQYAKLPGFEKFAPRLAALEYVDGKEIVSEFELQGKHEYLLLLKTAVEGAAVADNFEDLNFLAQFLKRAEKDKRAQVVMSNNRSGRRIFLVLAKSADGVRAIAHHPMHSVSQLKGNKNLEYSYLDNLEDVQSLKEVRRIVKTKEVKALLEKTGGRARISFEGSDKNGFQFSVRGVDKADNLKGSLKKGRVQFE